MDNNTGSDDAFVNDAARNIAPTGDLFLAAAEKYGRGDPATFARLLRGQYAVESANGRNTNHIQPATGKPSGAQGPMGLMPAVQKKFGVTDPQDLGQSVNAAAQYLAEGYDATGNLSDALRYYHGGPNRRLWGPLTNAYPEQVASHGEVPAQALAAQSGGTQSDLEGFINQAAKEMGPVQAPASGPALRGSTASPPAGREFSIPNLVPAAKAQLASVGKNSPLAGSAPHWGTADELGNAYLLGAGPTLEGVGSWLRGNGFAAGKEAANVQRNEYERDHPLAAFTENLVGSAPVTIGSLALGGEGAAAAGAQISRLLPAAEPYIAPALRFLGGTAGVGERGALAAGLRAGSRVVAGALQGAAAGTEQSGLYSPSTREQAGIGAETGAVLNPLLGPVFSKGALWAAKAIPELRDLATRMDSLGVPLRGGQITSDARVQAMDKSLIPTETKLEQVHQFHNALGRTAGLPPDENFTPQVLGDQRKAIGQSLDDIGSRTTLHFDNETLHDLSEFENSVKSDPNLTDSQRNQLLGVKEIIEDQALLGTKASNGTAMGLDGPDYGKMTEYKGLIGRLAYDRVNPIIKDYGTQLRDILDSTRDRTDPSIGGEWKAARTQWKNLRVIEDWVGQSPSGLGDPTKLYSYVKRVYPQMNSTDIGPLGTLARGGKLLDKPTPTGGIAPASKGLRLDLHSVGPLAAGAGLVMEHLGHIPLGGLGETALGALVAKYGWDAVKGALAKRTLSTLASPRYTNALVRGAATPRGVNPMIPYAVGARNFANDQAQRGNSP